MTIFKRLLSESEEADDGYISCLGCSSTYSAKGCTEIKL